MSKIDFQNGFALGFASGGVVEVEDTSRIDALEELIDQSGVLDSAEGSMNEKVEQLLYICDFMFNNRALYFGTDCTLESIDFYIDMPNLESISQFLRENKHVKRLVGINTSKVTTFGYCFMNSVVEEIERPLDFSSASGNNTYTAFRNANCLKEVRLKPETLKLNMEFSSAVLSAESIQSIIDGLATVETAQTLTLHSNSTLTDKQKATINEKGWTLAQ